MDGQRDWLDWAVELQALGQAGEAYANNAYFQSLSVYDRKYNTVWCYNERDKK